MANGGLNGVPGRKTAMQQSWLAMPKAGHLRVAQQGNLVEEALPAVMVAAALVLAHLPAAARTLPHWLMAALEAVVAAPLKP